MPIEVSGYDRYFSDRLNGEPAWNEVLDDLPYYRALRLCDILGAMVTAGDRRALIIFQSMGSSNETKGWMKPIMTAAPRARPKARLSGP